MNYPKTAEEWTFWRSNQRARQTKINDQIKTAFDKIMLIGFQIDTDFWDDYLHFPEDINGSSTDQRWNKNTLFCMREQIQEDLLALIDSDNQQLNNAICQIIVDNFSKFLV